jgi:hypothetical protein
MNEDPVNQLFVTLTAQVLELRSRHSALLAQTFVALQTLSPETAQSFLKGYDAKFRAELELEILRIGDTQPLIAEELQKLTARKP